MSSIPPPTPSGSPADSARLQQVTWDSDEERVNAERLDRRLGDAELLKQIRSVNFAGRDYDYFATELARYGQSVLKAWIERGTIFKKVAEKGRSVGGAPREWPVHEAESLAGEVVAAALTNFVENVLRPGRWDPYKGASLTTFFVGQCLLTFPNIYRTWKTGHDKYRDIPAEDVGSLAEPDVRLTAVEDDLISTEAVAGILKKVKSKDARKAFLLADYGYTQAEIAARLGKTEKAVERMIAYARQQLRQRGTG